MESLTTLEQATPFVQLRRWDHRGARHRYPESAHDTFEIALVRRGRVRYAIGSRTLEAGAGAVIVVPATVAHRTGFESAVVADALQLCADRVGGIARAAGVAVPSEAFEIRESRRVKTLSTLLHEEATTDRAGRAQAIDALCDALALEVLRDDGASGEARVDPRVRRAIDLAHARYADPIGVEDLARAAAMSRYHFSRCFRAQVGSSPYQFLQRVRVQRAASLLRSGRSVAEVAHAVGIADASRFARAFAREVGCTPSRFAASRAAA